MRKAGALTNITARPLSADQLITMLRGSEINALIPSVDGEGPTGQITAGRRTATAQVARRGNEIVVSLTRTANHCSCRRLTTCCSRRGRTEESSG